MDIPADVIETIKELLGMAYDAGRAVEPCPEYIDPQPFCRSPEAVAACEKIMRMEAEEWRRGINAR